MAPDPLVEPTALLGGWTLSRLIDDLYDRHTATRSRVVGGTELTLEPDGRVRWFESGMLTKGDIALPVTRVLFVEPREGGWVVTFEDGRDFHPWAPGHEVVHDCAPDTYTGCIAVVDSDHWTVEWRVTGPAKDYSMSSTLIRRDDGPHAS